MIIIIIINHFPVIQAVNSKGRHFSTFFAHFRLPWVRPWDNRGKCYMDGKRIQCWSNTSHVCIYLQPYILTPLFLFTSVCITTITHSSLPLSSIPDLKHTGSTNPSHQRSSPTHRTAHWTSTRLPSRTLYTVQRFSFSFFPLSSFS